MKYFTLLITLLLSNVIFATALNQVRYEIDTIPPPVSPSLIMGEDSLCVGETAVYTADIPVGCNANWYINNELQTSNTGILEVVWNENGSFLINLDFECNTITTPVDSLEITIADVPNMPMPIVGDTEVCSPKTILYSTEVGDNELCQWIVDGVIQVSDTNFMSYYWTELGMHIIEVRAINYCGIGDVQFLDVDVVDLPIVNLGNDTTIFQGQTIILNAGNQGSSYLWSTGEITQSIIVSQSGNYEVIVSNACGDVFDDINVDVVVDINEQIKSPKIVVVIAGDNISVNIANAKIEKVQIWDMAGRLIINSSNNRLHHLPQKGIFYINAIADDGEIYSCKVLKK